MADAKKNTETVSDLQGNVTETRPADPIPASELRNDDRNGRQAYETDVDNLADTDLAKESTKLAENAEPTQLNVVVNAHKSRGVNADSIARPAQTDGVEKVESKGFTAAPAGVTDAPVVDPATAEVEADMTPRRVQKVTPAPPTV